MSQLDWIVLLITLLIIISYGLYKSKTSKNLEGYFLSNRNMPWYLVLLSIMGTQASAITFLSAPGQAFTDGMRFVQYYFGLPLAMILICVTFLPLYSKLKVFTAYEFLETRFDGRVRSFAAALFLISRGLSTGISIYAPSIILSSLLHWDIFYTNILMGGLLIIYTVSGGAKAIAYTQTLQFIIIFIGMFLSVYYIVKLLPNNIGFNEAWQYSKSYGKLNVITSGVVNNSFNFKDKYNIFSGIIGGFFLALSYFGTDQSQVGRYLTAKNSTESKRGLLLNGLIKVPMQFLILLVGSLLFVFYQFKPMPVYFDSSATQKVNKTIYKDSLQMVQLHFDKVQTLSVANFMNKAKNIDGNYNHKIAEYKHLQDSLRHKASEFVIAAKASKDGNDTNYIFLRFVIDNLPKGLVGLLIAIIFLSAWGSIAAALNSLAGCTIIDFYLRYTSKNKLEISDTKKYNLSKIYTLFWGVFSIVVAELATGMGSLIEAVNVLGSLFYGVILGIFLTAFYCKKTKATSVLYSAIIGEIIVIILFVLDKQNIIGLGFLWLNVVGALLVVAMANLIQWFLNFRLQKQKIHTNN
jgi:solute:Na+ symporter, SSS family